MYSLFISFLFPFLQSPLLIFFLLVNLPAEVGNKLLVEYTVEAILGQDLLQLGWIKDILDVYICMFTTAARLDLFCTVFNYSSLYNQ